jgi:hypothetical protein
MKMVNSNNAAHLKIQSERMMGNTINVGKRNANKDHITEFKCSVCKKTKPKGAFTPDHWNKRNSTNEVGKVFGNVTNVTNVQESLRVVPAANRNSSAKSVRRRNRGGIIRHPNEQSNE